MICTNCSSDGVLVTVLGKDSWYCRTCKTDIKLDTVSPMVLPPTAPANHVYIPYSMGYQVWPLTQSCQLWTTTEVHSSTYTSIDDTYDITFRSGITLSIPGHALRGKSIFKTEEEV